ncbi:unnamed protein product, partial [Prunus brigantina]
MRLARTMIFYLDFVESRYIQNELKTLTKEKWVKEDQSEVVLSHPPVEKILINHGHFKVVAAPFKVAGQENDKKLIEQSNYTNQSLVVIGKQLDKIETKVDKLLPSEPKLKSKEKPLVQFQDLKPAHSLKTSTTMKKIEGMLEQLTPIKTEKSGLKVLGSSAPLVIHSDSELDESMETIESSNISKIENAFKNLELESELKVKRLTNRVNPTSLTKNWYPKPTPHDIQFEERNNLSQFSVSYEKLYEWNIDGLSEQEIMNKLTHMSMVANSYITNHNLHQSEIVPLLETGFTGTLRSWWDRHLTDESRNAIIHPVKSNDEGLPLFDENLGRGIEDGVNSLLYTIVEHFIGTPSHTQARIHDQLSNLRCPQLSDFRWYKDVFISRVMLREDTNIGKSKGKDKSKVKCFKCQKYGHYANDCKVKDTIRQLKITDEEKDNLIKVLELRNSESSENETIVSNSES